MEKLYQDNKDIAQFYMVYISEAHAIDDRRPVPYAKELGIKEHTSFSERCSVAGRLLKDKQLSIPCLVDEMEGTAEKAYKAWPDRIYLVRKDGRLGVASRRGPWGFAPALKQVKQWLADYRRTGTEPDIADSEEQKEQSTPQRTGTDKPERGPNKKPPTEI